MTSKLLTLLLLITPIICAADWLGDTADYQIASNNFYLEGKASGGSSIIYQQTEPFNSFNYQFDLNLDFPPSTSNRFVFYLGSTSAVFDEQNCLLLEIGESGSLDGLQLRQIVDGIPVIDTTLSKGSFASAFDYSFDIAFVADSLTIWVRDQHGVITSFSTNDVQKVEYDYYGFACNYTSTRKDKFQIRNINYSLLKEATPLQLDYEQINSHTLRIFANQDLPEQISYNPEPLMIEAHGQQVDLLFPTSITDINLIIEGEYLDGRTIRYDTLLNFASTPTGSVLISELMIDPTPAWLLPEVESVELYNPTGASIDITDWDICNKSTCQKIPSFTLASGEFVVLSETKIGDKWLHINQLPSLNNEQDSIYIKDKFGRVIHRVFYDTKRLDNKEGGISIELTDFNNPCHFSAQNWSYSTSYTGGTPGKANSTVVINSPMLDKLNVSLYDDSMRVQSPEMVNLNSYDFSAMQSNIEFAAFRLIDDELSLSFNKTLEVGQTYYIETEIRNCVGQSRNFEASFLLPNALTKGDVKFNEILIEHETADCQYVELKLNQTINSNQVHIGVFKAGSLHRVFTPLELIILNSDDFPVITNNKQFILENHAVPNPDLIFELADFSFYKSNPIVLLNDNGEVIDSLNIQDFEDANVPLAPNSFAWERNENNWFPAGINANFGSPSRANSVESVNIAEEDIYLKTPTFSPNGDGFEDMLSIVTQLKDASTYANISVFDRNGLLIKQLYQEVLLSPKGEIYWDGTDQYGNIVSTNVYIVWIESYRFDGAKQIYKLPVTVNSL